MEQENLQATSKPLSNQPVYCPWTSKAPFTSTVGTKSSQSNVDCQYGVILNAQNHNNSNNNGKVQSKYPNGQAQEPSMQQSSSQFFHFLRLMQLFPDVHPATLHTVMALCQNNFFAAVDKLLYAKKYKEVCRKTPFQRYDGNRLVIQRHQPYCCGFGGRPTTQTTMNPQGINGSNFNQTFLLQNMVNNLQFQQSKNLAHFQAKEEAKKVIIRNKLRKNISPQKQEKIGHTNQQNGDLQPVASPHCQLPINPLSPMNSSAQDLSISSNKENHSPQ